MFSRKTVTIPPQGPGAFHVAWVDNKFQSPSALGYSDVNLGLLLPVGDDRKHVAECQLLLSSMSAIAPFSAKRKCQTPGLWQYEVPCWNPKSEERSEKTASLYQRVLAS